jgi:hypothetical protein
MGSTPSMSSFAVTWDYRCPFARIAHDHVITALEGGADWDVTFLPFSLNQAHVEEGGTPVWEDPTQNKNLFAMEAALVVRDRMPERFLTVHRALFDLKHANGGDLRDRDQVLRTLREAGVDPDEVAREVEDGWPRDVFRKEHERFVADLSGWGVPTFIVGDQAVFVRLMHGPNGDVDLARQSIERVLNLLVGWPDLNEFKHTSLSH